MSVRSSSLSANTCVWPLGASAAAASASSATPLYMLAQLAQVASLLLLPAVQPTLGHAWLPHWGLPADDAIRQWRPVWATYLHTQNTRTPAV